MKWSGVTVEELKMLIQDHEIAGRDHTAAALEELIELREKYRHLMQIYANHINEPYAFPRAGERDNHGYPGVH